MSFEKQTVERAQQSLTRTTQRPQKISDVPPPNWRYALKRALNEFSADGCTDLAAGLTYFSILSVFPALLAIVSLLGVFGQDEETTRVILNLVADYAPAEVLSLVEQPIRQLTSSPAAGFALFTGIIGSLWTASGYVGAFGRALNRIYGVVEGRPVWILRPINLLVTTLMVLVVVLMLLVLLTSGTVLDFMSRVVPGLDLSSFATVWAWLRWPIILLLAVGLIALLYYGTPNVKQPRLRWLSPGAAFSLITMGISGYAFSFYVSNFGSYNATYGAIGGVIVLLLFLWIMNNVLLLGAQIDAELERSRELQAGIRAESEIQLPPRSDTQAVKLLEKREKLVRQGRDIRLAHNGLNYERAAQELDREK